MSLSDEKHIKELVARFKAGEATPAEMQALFGLIGEARFDQLLEKDMDAEIEGYLSGEAARHREARTPWFRYFAAASIILLVGMFIYFHQRNSAPGQEKEMMTTGTSTDVEPGSSKATLTLTDGRVIDLNSAANGAISGHDGIRIFKTKSGQIIYQIEEQASDQFMPEDLSYNTITTPRGGQWQVILPDGSGVWLNAGSSLRYPTRFSKDGRHVTLQGEAYFEIAKRINPGTGEREPFLVMTENQKIEVLGTHFNVNAYNDEKVARTTLLEGKVKLSHLDAAASIELKPGFTAELSGQSFTVAKTDVQAAVGWKNGDFIFDGQDLKTTMRQIARWYDVDIVYQDLPDNVLIGGTVSKENRLSVVLKALELTGKVKVRREGRRVTLSR